jgi:GT2 family glycosyltransferase
MTSKQKPLISIVFLNYNGIKFVEHWHTIFLQDYPNYEVIFVDNGSNDDSEIAFARIAHDFSRVEVKVVKIKENCGYSKANNLGVKEANGKYVVLLSNDIRVSRDWLRNAIAALESNERIGVAQSMMYQLDNPSKPDPMGNYIDVFGFNHPFLSSKDTVKEVFYCEGAVMFIRRQMLSETLGLFDESYFMFYEDIDFCWRARLMGYTAAVLRESVVYHRRGGTVSGTLMKATPKYVFTNTRNRLNTLLKNYSTLDAFKFIPISIVMEVAKGVSLIVSNKVPAGLSCFRGILAFLRGIKNAIRKRVVVQKRRKIGDDEIRKIMIPTNKALADTIGNIRSLRTEWKSRQNA